MNSSRDLRVEDVIGFYNLATGVFLTELSSLIKSSNGSTTWRPLITYKNVLRAIESIGTEMSLGLRFFGRGTLSNQNFVFLIEQHKLAREYLMQAETFSTTLKRDLDVIRFTPAFLAYNDTYNDIRRAKNITLDTRDELLKKLFDYFDNTVSVMNMLRDLIVDIRVDIQVFCSTLNALNPQFQDTIRSEVWAVNQEYALGILILAILVFISPVIVLLIRNAVRALQILSVALIAKLLDLKREKARSERLIYQMLPKLVADSIRNKKPTSEMFDSATILFSEIEDFNDLARSCNPLELFDMLDILYKTFDERIDRYDVYKVGLFYLVLI